MTPVRISIAVRWQPPSFLPRALSLEVSLPKQLPTTRRRVRSTRVSSILHLWHYTGSGRAQLKVWAKRGGHYDNLRRGVDPIASSGRRHDLIWASCAVNTTLRSGGHTQGARWTEGWSLRGRNGLGEVFGDGERFTILLRVPPMHTLREIMEDFQGNVCGPGF